MDKIINLNRRKKVSYPTEVLFNLENWNRYSVSSKYNDNVIKSFKMIYGREYLPDTKTWSFPIGSYKILLEKLKSIPDVTIIKPLSDKDLSKVQAIVSEIIESKFYIEIPYNEKANETFKQHKGTYANGKMWVFEADSRDALLKDLENLGIEIKFLKIKVCLKIKNNSQFKCTKNFIFGLVNSNMDLSEVKVYIKDWTDERFAVELATYCPPANQILKSFDDFEYQPEHKVWTFPIAKKEEIINKMKNEFDIIIV